MAQADYTVKTYVGWMAARVSTFAAFLAPFIPAWLIIKYGVDVPYMDQWDVAPFFERWARGTLTLSDLFAQQNEYRQFFPNIIFVALGRLTGWDVRYEMFVSLLLACFVAFGVRRLGARMFADPPRKGVLFLLASLLIFSTVQYENWLFGVQVVYLMPAACVVAGLLVANSERVNTFAAVTACACLSAVATFSSANGIVTWLVLPPAILGARNVARATWKLWLPPWCAGLALCAAVYAYGYHSPVAHPSTYEALRHPLAASAYFVAFLGGPLVVGRFRLAVSLLSGACALALYAVSCAYIFKFRGDRELLRRSAAWVSLGAYSLGTGALVTVGRLGFGINQAMSARYVGFSLYLMVALVYLLPYVAEDAARKGYLAGKHIASLKQLGVMAAVILVLAHIAIFVFSVRDGAAPWRRGRLAAKACLLFIEVAPNEKCLAEGVYPDVRVLRERVESLDLMGYIRPPLIRGGVVRDIAADVDRCSDDYGSFETLSLQDGAYVAEGFARIPRAGRPADAVVLAFGMNDNDQKVFTLAEVGAKSPRDDPRWRKTFPAGAFPAAPGVDITAWAFDAEEGKAYRLCGTHASVPSP